MTRAAALALADTSLPAMIQQLHAVLKESLPMTIGRPKPMARVPQARVVRIPRANHFAFRSNEADVLREMRSFIDGLVRP